MQQACAENSFAYRLAAGASIVLGASWLLYLACLMSMPITKQSVFMGPITVYTAILMLITGFSVCVLLGALARLAWVRSRMVKKALAWCGGAVLIVIAVWAITGPMIDSATAP